MNKATQLEPNTEVASPSQAALLSAMTIDEKLAAARFNETTRDGEGYDVDKAMMRRLSRLGLVEHKGGGYYEQTDLMLKVEDKLNTFRFKWNDR